jgi:hypothetical protein
MENDSNRPDEPAVHARNSVTESRRDLYLIFAESGEYVAKVARGFLSLSTLTANP